MDIREAGYGSGGVVVIGIRFIDAFVKSRKDLGGLKGGHVEEAAPDFGAREAAGREARDDAEVVGASFEGAPEVRVR